MRCYSLDCHAFFQKNRNRHCSTNNSLRLEPIMGQNAFGQFLTFWRQKLAAENSAPYTSIQVSGGICQFPCSTMKKILGKHKQNLYIVIYCHAKKYLVRASQKTCRKTEYTSKNCCLSPNARYMYCSRFWRFALGFRVSVHLANSELQLDMLCTTTSQFDKFEEIQEQKSDTIVLLKYFPKKYVWKVCAGCHVFLSCQAQMCKFWFGGPTLIFETLKLVCIERLFAGRCVKNPWGQRAGPLLIRYSLTDSSEANVFGHFPSTCIPEVHKLVVVENSVLVLVVQCEQCLYLILREVQIP